MRATCLSPINWNFSRLERGGRRLAATCGGGTILGGLAFGCGFATGMLLPGTILDEFGFGAILEMGMLVPGIVFGFGPSVGIGLGSGAMCVWREELVMVAVAIAAEAFAVLAVALPLVGAELKHVDGGFAASGSGASLNI